MTLDVDDQTRSHADRVARSVIAEYDRLPKHGKPQGKEWTVLAGIVDDNYKCLVLATGTRCVSRSDLGATAGAAGAGGGGANVKDKAAVSYKCRLRDCHAEVLVQRGFRHYLQQEQTGLYCDGADVTSRRDNGHDGAGSFHFYSSCLPCGCAAEVSGIPTGAKCLEGRLRTKPIDSRSEAESRSLSMSCSDKIARWNCCGWGGVGGLRMNSIVIGGPAFDEEKVAHALACGTDAGRKNVADQERCCAPATTDNEGRKEDVDLEDGVASEGLPTQNKRRRTEKDEDVRTQQAPTCSKVLHTSVPFDHGRPEETAARWSHLVPDHSVEDESAVPRPAPEQPTVAGSRDGKVAKPPTCGYSVIYVAAAGPPDEVKAAARRQPLLSEVLVSATGLKQGFLLSKKAKMEELLKNGTQYAARLQKFQSALSTEKLARPRPASGGVPGAHVEKTGTALPYRKRKTEFHKQPPWDKWPRCSFS